MLLMSTDEAERLATAAIFRQLTEGVIVTDVVGTIKFVNKAAATMHGVAKLDVKPTAYSETYHLYREDGRPYPSDDLPLARAVRGETVTDARWLIRRPDGVQVLAIGTAQPLHAADGRRIGALLTLRDHTAFEAKERSLHASEEALRQARQRADQSRAPDAARLALGAAVDDVLAQAEQLAGEPSVERQGTFRKAVKTLAALLDRSRVATTRPIATDTHRDLDGGAVSRQRPG